MLLCPECRGQLIMGADALGTGQAVTAVSSTPWALFANPASVNTLRSSISFYSVQYYGLKGLTDVAVAFNYPIGRGAMAWGVHRYGEELFSEYNIVTGYAIALSGEYKMGLVLNYRRLSFGGVYGGAGSLNLNAGLITTLFDKLVLGIRVTNLNRAGFSGMDQMAPVELAFGLSYTVEERTRLHLDMVKDVRFPVSWRSGLEMDLASGFIGRLGYTTEPLSLNGGFGYLSPGWKVNMALQKHEFLGLSPAIDMTVFFR